MIFRPCHHHADGHDHVHNDCYGHDYVSGCENANGRGNDRDGRGHDGRGEIPEENKSYWPIRDLV